MADSDDFWFEYDLVKAVKRQAEAQEETNKILRELLEVLKRQ
jgi:hypothetical protein